MKFLKTVIFLLTFFVYGDLSAQNTKHTVTTAKIKYKITQISDKGINNKPIDYTLYIKKEMSRIEMNSDKGVVTVISDNLANFGYILMENSGQKFAMKTDRSAMLKKNGIDPDPQVEITRESKVIAGYTCYKAVITSKTKDGQKVYDVWFTNQIKGTFSYDTEIKGLNGLMMEFETMHDGTIYKMIATEVEPLNDIPDSMFKVPDDYQIMEMPEMPGGIKK